MLNGKAAIVTGATGGIDPGEFACALGECNG